MTGARQFAYTLALALGQPNVDVMLAQIANRHWLEWQQFYLANPFGSLRSDMQMARICSVMANLWARKKGDPAFPDSDFMLIFDERASAERKEPVQEKSGDELFNLVVQYNLQVGGKFVHREQESND